MKRLLIGTIVAVLSVAAGAKIQAAKAYSPATLISCTIEISPRHGSYYLGVYRLIDRQIIQVAFKRYCPTMIDADEYFIN